MPQNHRSHRPDTETPPPSSVQDYLARKYASLGIDPPEPNGHQPGHIPPNFTDERSEPACSKGDEPTDSAHSQGEQRSDPASKPCDERSNVANLPPEPGSRTPDPAPTASPQSVPQNPHPASATNAPRPKPLTRDQRTALDLLDRGLSVTEIMDTLGYHRKTFYDWGKANPAFAHAAESARDNRRGVLADGVHDLQLAALSLVGNYICVRASEMAHQNASEMAHLLRPGMADFRDGQEKESGAI
jgi:hypothetical protein